MKKLFTRLLILLPYFIPYAFLTIWFDMYIKGLLFWLIMPLVFWGLLIMCIRTKNIPVGVLGNIISFIISYYYTSIQSAEKWEIYFKPFTATGFVIFMSINILILQLIVGAIYIRHKSRKVL